MELTEAERSLIKDFKKKELVTLARELEFNSIPEQSSAAWVAAILDDIYLNGAPKFMECSDLMVDFMVAAGIYDKKGKLLVQEEEPVSKDKPKKQSKVEAKQPVGDEMPKPECYTFWDSEDPACKRCKIAIICRKAQKDAHPECFGKSLDTNAPECQGCIIEFMCAEAPNNQP